MKPIRFFLLFALVAVLGVSACNIPTSPAGSAIEQTQVYLSAQATLTAQALQTGQAATPQATPTALPILPSNTHTSVPPSSTPVPPSATPPPDTQTPTRKPDEAVRLSMAPGGTNLSFEGNVPTGTVRHYVFGAQKDQLLDFSITSQGYISFALRTAAGEDIVPAKWGWTWYRAKLPADGDYYLDVIPNPNGGNFTLYMMLPERLKFAEGSNSLTATGQLSGGKTHNYIFTANKGQTLTVSVGPGTNIALSVWAVSGTVLISRMGEVQQFSDVLPESGDYILDVFTAADSGVVNYSMSFSVK